VIRTIRNVAAALALPVVLGACGGGSVGAGGSSTTSADTTQPVVSLSSPTSSAAYSTTSASVSIAGSASDNVGVVSVGWRNAGNGASGSASGTGSWSVANVALVTGVNNITVTARDAAGNEGGFTLAVTYDPTGASSLSGNVDSSLINRSASVNMVYLYAGAGVTPGDLGGSGAQPVATAPVTQDNGACTFSYRFGAPPAGDGAYTVAFVNQADNPSAGDAITFRGTATVALAASGSSTYDFAPARRLQVGPTRSFTTPSAAAAAAQSGDVIEIDAGEYLDDIVVWRQNRITLRGVGGGRAHLRSTKIIPFISGNDAANGKGIWVVQGSNTTVENMEFSGAAVTDENGAGIRDENSGLTVCNGYFHDNENGILGSGGAVLIEYSEFDHNGKCPQGANCAHNIYIDGGSLFILRYSYSHRAHVGHNVKSRAQETRILYNRIMDETDGDASYAIDIPQVGRTFIIGNLIQQGPNTDNSTIVAYGAESAANGTQELYVVNNTVVNDLHSGTFFDIRGGTTARFVNNIFAGGGSVPTASASITMTTNLVFNPTSGAGLADPANFDYHLTAGSSARDAGTDPGTSPGGFALAPTSQYVHPTNRQDRSTVGSRIDIGAYEFQ
jgi:hypothetical protein